MQRHTLTNVLPDKVDKPITYATTTFASICYGIYSSYMVCLHSTEHYPDMGQGKYNEFTIPIISLYMVIEERITGTHGHC